MIVRFDGGRRGWIDNVFEGLDEFWVCDLQTKQLVFQANPAGAVGDVRSFRAADLLFTGEWSRSVEKEAVVQIPPEVVDSIVGTEDWESKWEERTKVVLQIECLVAGAPGRILIGPGFPPDVQAAHDMLSDHVRELQRKQKVTETLEVPAEHVMSFKKEDGWEARWEERTEVPVCFEAPEAEGSPGRILVGPGPKAVVQKALGLLTEHLQELAELRLGDGGQDAANDAAEVTSEDIQAQLDKLKAEQEEEAKAERLADEGPKPKAEEEESTLDTPEGPEPLDMGTGDQGPLDARVVPASSLKQAVLGVAQRGPPSPSSGLGFSPSWSQGPGSEPATMSKSRSVAPIVQKASMLQRPTLDFRSMPSGAASFAPGGQHVVPPPASPFGKAAAAQVQAKARLATTGLKSWALPAKASRKIDTVSAISGGSATARAARAKLAALQAAEAAGGEPPVSDSVEPSAQTEANSLGKLADLPGEEGGQPGLVAGGSKGLGDGGSTGACEPGPECVSEPGKVSSRPADAEGEMAEQGGASDNGGLGEPQLRGPGDGTAEKGSGAGPEAAPPGGASGEAAPQAGHARAPAGQDTAEAAGSAAAPAAGATAPMASDDTQKTIGYWADNQAQFADLPPLPNNWIRIKSKSSGTIYYANLIDGTTALNMPGAGVKPGGDSASLPPGWMQLTSRSTGQVYYWNAAQGKSQFERPTA